jgi:hypothetical protein
LVTFLTKDNQLRCLVTIAAVAAAIVHVVFPSVVPDAITAGFLVLAFLPWLAPLIKTVEVPGVGKIELREVERKAEEAKGAAASAVQKADLALAGAGDVTQNAPQLASQGLEELNRLAAEYNTIRSTQRSGPARTSAMTAVVSKMIRATAGLSPDEIRKALKESDAGWRLVGYAALYAHPNPDLLECLVSSVTGVEDKPFGQYWGILAIGSVIGKLNPDQVSARVVRTLQDFLKRLQPGTDRYYELSRILKGFTG